MSKLFRFSNSVKQDSLIDTWMRQHSGDLGDIAKHWFEVMRKCGSDVREVLHDGHPTACVGDAAFAYVNAFKAHVNVGFFRGAEIADPAGLLEGAGKFMRHVKISPESEFNATALSELVGAAYADMKNRVEAESQCLSPDPSDAKKETTETAENTMQNTRIKKMKTNRSAHVTDGARCKVIGGVHAGKSGIVRDINTSKSGHITITVVQQNGDKFKTLGKNVAIETK
jgi:hypothetical protein